METRHFETLLEDVHSTVKLLAEGLTAVIDRLDRHDCQFQAMDRRFCVTDSRLLVITDRLDGHDQRLDQIDNRLARVESDVR